MLARKGMNSFCGWLLIYRSGAGPVQARAVLGEGAPWKNHGRLSRTSVGNHGQWRRLSLVNLAEICSVKRVD